MEKSDQLFFRLNLKAASSKSFRIYEQGVRKYGNIKHILVLQIEQIVLL